MNGLNAAYFEVVSKLFELQAFFIKEAWVIGRAVFAVSLCSAAVNYGLTGTGLKENIIKMIKAVVFFFIVMGAYPRIVGWITEYTFNLAKASTYSSIEGYITSTTNSVKARANERMAEERSRVTYGDIALVSNSNYFSKILVKGGTTINGVPVSYTAVAPAAALQAMLLVAGECIHAADGIDVGITNMAAIPDKITVFLIGLVCAIAVIVCGSFALLEYLVSFLEFVFVTGVGIICFPLSLWDGSKFMAEKFISAVLGFFIKLLFSTICVFLMLYGFLSLAKLYTEQPFLGLIDQMLMVIFTSLMFFYISKSAPALAQSLLTGAPSLNAAGAIGTAAAAFSAVAGAAGLGAHAAVSGGSAVSQAGGAAKEASALSKESGGSVFSQGAAGLRAFGGSLAVSGMESARSAGNSLTRSLISHSPLYDRSNANRFSAAQRFMQQNDAGQNKTVTEFGREEAAHGRDIVKENESLKSEAVHGKTAINVNSPSASGKEKSSHGKDLSKENEPLKSGAVHGKNSN